MPETTSNDPNTESTARFVHLHLHSEYSLLDGGNKISALLDQVARLGMDAVAITDHGNIHGAMEFWHAATARDIKPILGIEAYVAPDRDGRPGDRRDRTATGVADGGFHLVLLAENQAGWENLLQLSSDAFLNGFYYKPRMDKSTLEAHCDGLIAINGHLGSSIAHHLSMHAQSSNQGHYEQALAEATWHKETFGVNDLGDPCFYVELQRHVPEQERINPFLKQLAVDLELPLVCDNDAHFLREEDHDIHDTLCCISMGKNKDDAGRLRYSESLYVKSPEQMHALFDKDEQEREALENTVRISDRCNVDLATDQNHAPLVDVVHPGFIATRDPDDTSDLTSWYKEYCSRFEVVPFDAEEGDHDVDDLMDSCDRAMRDLCEAGLIWRYGTDGTTPQIRERLDRELKILSDKKISAYFLIVWDFVNWARQNGIPSMARGSGVGTMVGYVLGLSNACPEHYGLLFERFTDPDRSEYPDIDIDICQDGRARVINYVREKYGHVAQIITFGRLKARAAIKDVARVMGLSPTEGQKLANLVPNELSITIEEALQKEPRLEEAASDPIVGKVLEHAQALEDHARHAGVHAAGVVVATRPLDQIVPLCRPTGGSSDDVVTQWDGPTCEKVGLLKMDFLGLRTLSIIERARRMIMDDLDEQMIWSAVGRQDQSDQPGQVHPLDLERITYDDPRVLELFRRGDTAGIFQFESGGMRKLLVDMQPDRLEDLIAANALYRPGPMELIPAFNARKNGREQVPRIHEIIDRHTSETYGVMVYQEQVMLVLHELGGIPLRTAYTIIKAISKKKHEVINAAREDFIAGSASKGVEPAVANELFDLILKFAGYGFNKSHSTGYAIIAYQTAYLKTYFPNQYMASLLSFESQARKIEDWSVYLDECRRVVFPDHEESKPHIGVEVKPPDLATSMADFAVSFEEGQQPGNCSGTVRFGLRAIKGAGDTAIRSIIHERDENGPFKSLFDFCERLDGRTVNRATMEALIKAGAFDSIHGVDNRASLLASLEDAINAGSARARDRREGQSTFFEAFDEAAVTEEAPANMLRQVEPWDKMKTLSQEKEALGFHVSGHPLDQYQGIIQTFASTRSDSIGQLKSDASLVMAGMITRLRPVTTQKGHKMAMCTIADRGGTVDGVIFPEAFSNIGDSLVQDVPVMVIGSLDSSRAEPGIIIERVIDIEQAPQHLGQSMQIIIDARESEDSEPVKQSMQMVSGLLRRFSSTVAALQGRPVEVRILLRQEQRDVLLSSPRMRVVPSRELLHQIEDVLGSGSVSVQGGFVPPARSNGRGRRGGRNRSHAAASSH